LAENDGGIFGARRAADGAVCVREETYRAKAGRAISDHDHPRAGAKNSGIRKRMEPGNGAASWSQQGLEGPPDSVRNHGVAAGGGVDLIGLV
jgi:hypothetical protein